MLAAWLTDTLDRVCFDVGAKLKPPYTKIHYLTCDSQLTSFDGIKIRIQPSLDTIDLMALLFLRKNVQPQLPHFTRDEYSLDTFTKLACWARDLFEADNSHNYSLYDHAIDFKDTFDSLFMQQFYRLINHRDASAHMIKILEETNLINYLAIDRNHACSIVKLVMKKERQLGLKEQDRMWSIVDIYKTTPQDKLYDTVSEAVRIENYLKITSTLWKKGRKSLAPD